MVHSHVFFQINNSEGFLVGPPNMDINKSRSFLCWLCSTHSWEGPLAPRSFPKMCPWTKQTYPWRCSWVCILCVLGAVILVRISYHNRVIWIANNYNAYVWCRSFMLAMFQFIVIRNCYGKFLFFSIGLLSRQSGFDSKFSGFQDLYFPFGFLNVGSMFRMSHQHVLMLISRFGFPSWISHLDV